jgi:two-component system, oxyanion-binding sensor
MTPLSLGYVPLVDAAPLIVAHALRFGAEEGLDLTLHPAPSWAALRDMLAMGQVQAAQMLAPLPVAMALGLAGPARFDALSTLNANGDVIGVSATIAVKMRANGYAFDFTDATAAAHALRAAAPTPLRIGVPFAFSMHRELVAYWLGADPIIHTVPPPRMAEALAAGEIDAFCVGEPWGSVAVDRGAGDLLLPGSAIWGFHPEKVLAVQAGWAEADPDLAGRLMRTIWRAGRWLGDATNSMMASEILSGPLGVTADIIERSLTGQMVISTTGDERYLPHMIAFHDGAATFPWRSQAAWIAVQLARRHGLDPGAAADTARAVFRTDLYRTHLAPAGADLPGASEKLEGALTMPTPVASERGRMILPPDRFFDARIFDPAHPAR